MVDINFTLKVLACSSNRAAWTSNPFLETKWRTPNLQWLSRRSHLKVASQSLPPRGWASQSLQRPWRKPYFLGAKPSATSDSDFCLNMFLLNEINRPMQALHSKLWFFRGCSFQPSITAQDRSVVPKLPAKWNCKRWVVPRNWSFWQGKWW